MDQDPAQDERELIEGLSLELGELELLERRVSLGQGELAVQVDLLLGDASARLWLVAEVDGAPATTLLRAVELLELARREHTLLERLSGANQPTELRVALVAGNFGPRTLEWLAQLGEAQLALFEWRTISSAERTQRILLALSPRDGRLLAAPTLEDFLDGLGENARSLVTRLLQLDPELELRIGREELRLELEAAAVCALRKRGTRLFGTIGGGASQELDGPTAAHAFLDSALAELGPRVGAVTHAQSVMEAALGNDPRRPILSPEELAAFRE